MSFCTDPLTMIDFFYPEDSPLRRLLLKHSNQVREKALAILQHSGLTLDERFVANAAMLHDIGIIFCHAPSIFCVGKEPYIAHGLIGGRMLREYAAAHHPLDGDSDIEAYARVCERHTGSGLTAAEVRRQNLPIPVRDYLPETPEEKLICLADKFFSKSGNCEEKTLSKVRRSMEKFGPDSLARFEQLCQEFKLVN